MKTEDRALYESRLKAERDKLWLRNSALAEGRKEGLEQGIEQGIEVGIEKGIEKGDLLGRIRLGRSVLGQPVLTEAEWRDKTLEELREWAERMEAELRRGLS